ncbi:MAG: diguanylate cyclase [Selenomonadaceae bacterium]|nr:diguanylate cyclase [Selenomonadaceae bacterium]
MCRKNFVTGKAREILKAAKNIFIEGMKIKITASIGAVTVSAAAEYEKVFALADKAVYFVKENGRNNFHINRN